MGRTGGNTLSPLLTAALGIGIGAAIMYMPDPEGGPRRRGRLRDSWRAWPISPGMRRGARSRTVVNRTRRLAIEMRSRVEGEVRDDVLASRGRAKLWPLVRGSGPVEITVAEGRIMLTGFVPADQVDRLVDVTASVRSARGVDSRLQAGPVAGQDG